MSVVDASVWVSNFWKGDLFHNQSKRWIKKVTQARQPLVAPTILLAEVGGAIARRTGNPKLGYDVVRAIMNLPTIQLVPVDEKLGALASHIASDYLLKGADSIYIAVAQQEKLPVVSWDQEQVSRVKGLVSTFTPDNLLSP